ncbi:MAG TPA: Ni/Fe-hydrogenase, b-type cytochrome subunit [Thermoanaerobaculia bacterium]|nr:Ni/Fe-hydrogenase, b-type cytochrome subunit [Thermoanaerobaculia bacterium]
MTTLAEANRRIHVVPSSDLARVYVWEWPVRITHWLIAASIIVLSATGIYIGRPFVISHSATFMATVKTVHSYTAIVFTLAVASRIAWMFVGNSYARWYNFIPVHRHRRKGLVGTFEFYVFLLRKPPGYVGHNPLAGMTYLLVFLLYFMMITTGFALYSMSAPVGSPMRAFQFLLPLFGNLQAARWIHHVGMWMLLGFAVHHVYSSILMSQVEANATTESIFSGYKFVPRQDVTEPGFRADKARRRRA